MITCKGIIHSRIKALVQLTPSTGPLGEDMVAGPRWEGTAHNRNQRSGMVVFMNALWELKTLGLARVFAQPSQVLIRKPLL